MTPLARTLLATSLSLLLAGGAIAADASPPADERELAAARAELERAVKRYAELAGAQAREASRMAGEARRLAGTAAEFARGRPVLGVLLEGDDQPGVRIAGVTPGSGAAEAGLRSGDRMVSVDGIEILGNSGQLRVGNARKLLAGLEADKPVRIGYLRDGRRATVDVTPGRDRRVAVIRAPDGGFGIVGDDVFEFELPGITPRSRPKCGGRSTAGRPGWPRHCAGAACTWQRWIPSWAATSVPTAACWCSRPAGWTACRRAT